MLRISTGDTDYCNWDSSWIYFYFHVMNGVELKIRTQYLVSISFKNLLFTSKLDLNLRKNVTNGMPHLSIALCGAGVWTLRKIGRNIFKFEMWCWRWIKKICWSDRVKNGVYHRVKEEMNIVCTVQRRKTDWIGHILHRNGLVRYVIAGKTEGMKEGWRRQKIREFYRRRNIT